MVHGFNDTVMMSKMSFMMYDYKLFSVKTKPLQNKYGRKEIHFYQNLTSRITEYLKSSRQ